ncbi:MAG: DUF397 domain-containing protein [Sciscionella sp.]
MTRVTGQWRKSSYSNTGASNGDCVEAAQLSDGRMAVRDSKAPDAGMLSFTWTEMNAWLASVKSGEFDNLS